MLLLFSRSVSDSCDSMNSCLPGSSVHEISQSRSLEWVAISFFSGSSRPRDQTLISCGSRWIRSHWAARETLVRVYGPTQPLPRARYRAFPTFWPILRPTPRDCHWEFWHRSPSVTFACFAILYKWNHSVSTLLSGFFHSSLCLWDLSILLSIVVIFFSGGFQPNQFWHTQRAFGNV